MGKMYPFTYGPLNSEVKMTRNGICALFPLSYSTVLSEKNV